MKIVFVSIIFPNFYATEGGGITCHEFIRGMKSAGHELIFVHLQQDLRSDVDRDEFAQARESLSKLGIDEILTVNLPREQPSPWVEKVPQPFRFLAARVTESRMAARVHGDVSGKIGDILKREKPDVCFTFVDAIRFTPSINGTPIACWAIHSGEPYREIAMDLGLWRVLRSKTLAQWAYPVWLKISRQKTARIMRKARTVIMHSYVWGKNQEPYFRNTHHFWAVPHPGPDAASQISRKDLHISGGTEPFDIILIGRKRTSFGRANIEYLIEEIAPEIQRRGLEDRFRFSLVGPQAVAKAQAERLKQYPFIVDEGYAENIAERVSRADVLLHAVKYLPAAGSRFGILCSMSPCLVAHEAIRETVPELVEGDACLTANDGTSFVDSLLTACVNRDRNRTLRQNARTIFEKHYTYELFFEFLDEALHATAGLNYDPTLISMYTYDLNDTSLCSERNL